MRNNVAVAKLDWLRTKVWKTPAQWQAMEKQYDVALAALRSNLAATKS